MTIVCRSCDTQLSADSLEEGVCDSCGQKVPISAMIEAEREKEGDTPIYTTEGLREPRGRNAAYAESDELLLDCPQCNEPTDSLKWYRFPLYIFLLVAVAANSADEAGCPSCIRKRIGYYSLVNILTANLLWPFVIFPWMLILLLRSFSSGHSKSILKRIG